MSYPALLSWCEKQALQFAPYITDTSDYLNAALAQGKKVVLEAQLGAMRDIDYGIFLTLQVLLRFLPMVPSVLVSPDSPSITLSES